MEEAREPDAKPKGRVIDLEIDDLEIDISEIIRAFFQRGRNKGEPANGEMDQ